MSVVSRSYLGQFGRGRTLLQQLIATGRVYHLKNPAGSEELSKTVRISPIIGIRILCNHCQDVHLVFEAHKKFPLLRAVNFSSGGLYQKWEKSAHLAE
jgi:hypothetical protein